MLPYIATFIVGILFGILLVDYILTKTKDDLEDIDDQEDYEPISIELHDSVFFAYSQSSKFLGQSHCIATLTHQLLGEGAKINLCSEDPRVISELEQLASKLQSCQTAPETTPKI